VETTEDIPGRAVDLAPVTPSLRQRLAQSQGKRYRWIVWSALCVVNFNQNVQMYAASMLVPYLLAELELSYSLAGTLLSAYSLALAVVITPIGMLGDRLGARRVLMAGQVLMLAGTLLFALANSFAIAFLSRIVTGVGATAAITTSGPLAAFWFSVREFRVVHGTGTAVGKAGSVAVMWFLPTFIVLLGWRLGYGVVSITGPLALLAAMLFIASRPADVGLPPVQMFDAAAAAKGGHDAERLSLWHVIRRPGVLALAGASLFYFAAYFSSINWLPTYLANVLGMDKVEAGFQSGIVLWGTILGYVLTGPAANRIGRCRPLYTGGLALSGVSIGVLALGVGGLPGPVLAVFFVLLGLFCSGLLFMTPMLAVLVPRSSMATASGFVFTTSYIGAVALPPLIGAVADLTGSLAIAFWLPAACAILGALVSLLIDEPSYPTQPPSEQ
jgi:sugar phosphate permease